MTMGRYVQCPTCFEEGSYKCPKHSPPDVDRLRAELVEVKRAWREAKDWLRADYGTSSHIDRAIELMDEAFARGCR